jgi:hypothetical protein
LNDSLIDLEIKKKFILSAEESKQKELNNTLSLIE